MMMMMMMMMTMMFFFLSEVIKFSQRMWDFGGNPTHKKRPRSVTLSLSRERERTHRARGKDDTRNNAEPWWQRRRE
jgi:hypothetical protein